MPTMIPNAMLSLGSAKRKDILPMGQTMTFAAVAYGMTLSNLIRTSLTMTMNRKEISMDYEALILARQEAIETAEFNGECDDDDGEIIVTYNPILMRMIADYERRKRK